MGVPPVDRGNGVGGGKRVRRGNKALKLIIDGYNVIFALLNRPVSYGSGECERLRTELLERLEHYRVLRGEDITVVFDGGPGGAHLARLQHFGGLTVIFSDPGSDADAEIKRLVRESTGARDLCVVTDDNSIAAHVRRFRAKVATTADLLRRLEQAEKREGEAGRPSEPPCKFEGPAPYEVADWVAEFGDLDEDDIDEEELREE